MLKGENGASQAVIRRVKHLRERKGYSSYDLARRIGAAGLTITAQGITLQERGATLTVTVDYVVAAAKALEVSVTWLLGLEVCERCQGSPPPGFICVVCEAEGACD
jgi:transcriptional regulator with XRE-family HTH domain